MSNSIGKIVAVTGPTASGKTRLGVKLAVLFRGEIVSADSRQVYRGLDVGTGKDLKEFSIINHKFSNGKEKQTEANLRVPYHLIDIVDPNEDFSLADYQRRAYEAIDDILTRGKLPVIVGGTGLYLEAVVDGYILPPARPDHVYRRQLESRNADELFSELERMNKAFASRLNNSDRHNKRRLIRYLEVEWVRPRAQPGKREPRYEALVIGMESGKEELEKRIRARLSERLEREDMIGEVERLQAAGVSWERLVAFGLEYKYISYYLLGRIDYEAMVEELYAAIKKFAKRQLTWFRRWERQGREIKWIKNEKEAEKLVNEFLTGS